MKMKLKCALFKRIFPIFLVCLLIPCGTVFAMESDTESSDAAYVDEADFQADTSEDISSANDSASSEEPSFGETDSALPSDDTVSDAERDNTNSIPEVRASAYQLKTGSHDKYMSGYPGAIFKPDIGITRAEFVSVVYNLMATKPEAVSGKFVDVTEKDWFATIINALANAGIINGIGNDMFVPNKAITRAEVVTVLSYFSDGTDHSNVALANHFSDVSGHWAYSYIQTSYANGWVVGDGGKFFPDKNISRAEVAAIMNRITKRHDDDYAKDRDTIKMRFKDVPTGHWAFLDVCEAAEPLASEPDPTPTPTPTPSDSEIGFIITTTDVNFRTEPSSDKSDTVIKALPSGTILTLLNNTSYVPWYKAKTNINGEVRTGYIHSSYVKNYTPSNTNGGDGVISATVASVPQYKSIYLNTTASGIVWSSSNTDVAKIVVRDEDSKKAFIYGNSPGTATIFVKDYNGTVKSQCTVTVTAAEPVRFAYSDPITPLVGKDFHFYAITDASKTDVKFVVSGAASGGYETSEYTVETHNSSFGLPTNTARIFKRTVNFAKAGDYTVKVYSKTSGSDWSSGYIEYKMTVSTASDASATTQETRSASTKLIEVLKSFEGPRSEVYIDTLSSNYVPTVGCGLVVRANNTFYNNMTTTEIDAQLIQTLKEGDYVSGVNNFAQKYGIKMNQYQFDALVSFAYNLGPGHLCIKNETFQVLVNATAPPSLPATGTVNNQIFGKNPTIYSEASSSSSTYGSIPVGSTVSVLNIKRIDGNVDQLWYRVNYNGTVGWIRGGHVGFSGRSCDLAYVDEQLFGSNLLEWNVAGGTHLPGLLYRRLGEAKIFCYGNYTDAMNDGNPNRTKNVGFDIPPAFL